MATADKQRRLLRMALKMARAPSEEGAGAALGTAVRAAAGREPSRDTCGGLAGHPPRAGARRGDTQCCLLHGPL